MPDATSLHHCLKNKQLKLIAISDTSIYIPTNHHPFGVEIHVFAALHASTHASQFVHASGEVSKTTPKPLLLGMHTQLLKFNLYFKEATMMPKPNRLNSSKKVTKDYNVQHSKRETDSLASTYFFFFSFIILSFFYA